MIIFKIIHLGEEGGGAGLGGGEVFPWTGG